MLYILTYREANLSMSHRLVCCQFLFCPVMKILAGEMCLLDERLGHQNLLKFDTSLQSFFVRFEELWSNCSD